MVAQGCGRSKEMLGHRPDAAQRLHLGQGRRAHRMFTADRRLHDGRALKVSESFGSFDLFQLTHVWVVEESLGIRQQGSLALQAVRCRSRAA